RPKPKNGWEKLPPKPMLQDRVLSGTYRPSSLLPIRSDLFSLSPRWEVPSRPTMRDLRRLLPQGAGRIWVHRGLQTSYQAFGMGYVHDITSPEQIHFKLRPGEWYAIWLL